MNLSWEKLIPEVVRQPFFYADEFDDGEPKLSGWDYLLSLVAPVEVEHEGDDGDDGESEYV